MIWSVLKKLIQNFLFFALHISQNNTFPPPLSLKEETELLEKSTSGDINARNKLVEHNLRLVVHIVKKYYSSPYDQDDLFSIGTVGLIKAVSTYNPQKGSRLATYSARCIENEILMYFRSSKKRAMDVHISDTIDTDKDGNSLTFSDILSDNSDIVESIDKKIKLSKLNEIIEKNLEQRERDIIILRYGLNGKEPLTQQEIAKKLKISRSYVSRIEKAALIKLKAFF